MKVGTAKAILSPRFSRSVDHQRVEDVAHRRGSAFDRKDVVRSRRRRVAAHLAHEIGSHDLFHVPAHSHRHRIHVADHRVGQLVEPRVLVELELVHSVVDVGF